ncbi:MAG TPA: hypothetical protein VGE37_10395, partial [Archangium sp.]
RAARSTVVIPTTLRSTDLLPTAAEGLRHLAAGAVLVKERHGLVRERVGGTGERSRTSMLRAHAPSDSCFEETGASPTTPERRRL